MLNEKMISENELLMSITGLDQWLTSGMLKSAYYTIIFITRGNGTFLADIGRFEFASPVLLFSTPLQQLSLLAKAKPSGYVLQFHSDFYCIEYHKARVACNGLLFNNIYIEPTLNLSDKQAAIFMDLCQQIIAEFAGDDPDEIVLRSYLQLFLAKSSSIKIKDLENTATVEKRDDRADAFEKLLEENFLVWHKPAEYADRLALSGNTLLKLCRQYFHKSPTGMIQERLILEAKKKLHLTRKSIKEIAYELHFSDEFYFSRFFKKFTGASPQVFRDSGGISIIAER